MAQPALGPSSEILHASAVAVGPRGLIISGASGSGKSTLAVQMLALGATLIADDRVHATRHPNGGVRLSAPEALRGKVEARGVGILTCEHTVGWATAVVDLDHVETDRLPPARDTVIASTTLPCLYKVETPAFPSILMVYLRGERLTP